MRAIPAFLHSLRAALTVRTGMLVLAVCSAALGVTGLLAPSAVSLEKATAGSSDLFSDSSISLQPFDRDSDDSSLVVDVNGAVVAPGVYSLPSGSRTSDAIRAAGGVSPEADLVFVTEELNLAQKIQDEAKIFIPKSTVTGQSTVRTVIASAASRTQPAAERTASISVNTASSSELETLDGIGEKRAEAIIANRPYASLQQLVDKKALSQSLLEALTPQLKL